MLAEERYIVRLMQAFVGSAGVPPEAPTGLNWKQVYRLLQTHGIAGTLAPLLSDVETPADARGAFEKQCRLARRRSGLLLLELARVLPALQSADIQTVLLKGGALGLTAYPGPDRRFSCDVDLLVRPRCLDAACEVLADLGYIPAETRRHSTFYEQHHFHRILKNSADVRLEVHWALSRPKDYFQFDIDGFLARSRFIEGGGLRVSVPSDTDQLLHAACQALREGFADLRRIIDAALLVRQGAAEDPILPELARRQGMATPLWLLLRLQQELAGVAVPSSLDSAIRPRPAIRRCLLSLELEGKVVPGDLFQHAGQKMLITWLCCPGTRAVLSEVRRFVFPGTSEHLDAGFAPTEMPRWPRRFALSTKQIVSLSKIVGYQGVRLARHFVSRRPAV